MTILIVLTENAYEDVTIKTVFTEDLFLDKIKDIVLFSDNTSWNTLLFFKNGGILPFLTVTYKDVTFIDDENYYYNLKAYNNYNLKIEEILNWYNSIPLLV